MILCAAIFQRVGNCSSGKTFYIDIESNSESSLLSKHIHAKVWLQRNGRYFVTTRLDRTAHNTAVRIAVSADVSVILCQRVSTIIICKLVVYKRELGRVPSAQHRMVIATVDTDQLSWEHLVSPASICLRTPLQLKSCAYAQNGRLRDIFSVPINLWLPERPWHRYEVHGLRVLHGTIPRSNTKLRARVHKLLWEHPHREVWCSEVGQPHLSDLHAGRY
jgi:hypothetical protein